jgi:hypothetical protein
LFEINFNQLQRKENDVAVANTPTLGRYCLLVKATFSNPSKVSKPTSKRSVSEECLMLLDYEDTDVSKLNLL